MAELGSVAPAPRQNSDETGANKNSSPNGTSHDAKELNPDLTRQEMHRGARAGDTYVRVVRPHGHLFKKVAPGVLRATEVASIPQTPAQQAYQKLKRVLIGERLPNQAESSERLSKFKALAIFASDAMSSVAYATEEILLVLALTERRREAWHTPYRFRC
jgi:hypothetical protein